MKQFRLFFLFVVLWLSSLPSFAQRTPTSYGDDGIHTFGDQNVEDRYVTRDKWSCPIITFFIANGTADISSDGGRSSILAALATWEASANIRFLETCNAASAQIVFTFFATSSHGDSPFNGAIAHTFFPPPSASGTLPGDVHFNDDKSWTNDLDNDDSSPFDLQTVALHEIGHAIGLDHSTASNPVMELDYEGSRRTLTQDDIDGIRSLYGAPDVTKLITGPPYLCDPHTSKTYYLACLPTGLSAKWTVDDEIFVSENGYSVTVKSSGNSVNALSTNITVEISSGCGSISITRPIALSYNEPLYAEVFPTSTGTPIQNYNTPCAINYNYFTTKVESQYAESYYWQYISGSGYINATVTNTVSGFVNNNALLTIKVYYVNKEMCQANNTMLFANYRSGMAIQPNPASDHISVLLDNSKSLEENIQPLSNDINRYSIQENMSGLIKEIRIFDLQGRLILEHLQGNGVEQELLNISALEAGTYVVEMIDEHSQKHLKTFIKE